MEVPYATPQDPLVADLVSRLGNAFREDFEERAGILQFDGQLPRAHAECLALLNVLRRHPAALTGSLFVLDERLIAVQATLVRR